MDKKKKSKTAVIIIISRWNDGKSRARLPRRSQSRSMINDTCAAKFYPCATSILPELFQLPAHGWHGFTHPATRITALITAAYQPNRANNRILSFLGSGVQTPGYQIFILALPSFLLQVFLFFPLSFFPPSFHSSKPAEIRESNAREGGRWEVVEAYSLYGE